MQARGDSHADNSHAGATARVGLSCAVAGSRSGCWSRSRRRVLCGWVGGTRRGHKYCLGDGRGEQADRLRRGRTLSEDSAREKLEGGCIRISRSRSSRSVASGTVRGSGSGLRFCCRRSGSFTSAVRCSRSPSCGSSCCSSSCSCGSRSGGRGTGCLGRCRHSLLYRLRDRLSSGVALALSFPFRSSL